MSLRFIAAFALLWLQLCGCASSSSSAVTDMDRRHDELMKTMPAGGGGGSM
ncbi:MAG TPA: hypothetical protein VFB13_02875 [Reyranella sp.]|jgi:hypothetical protein|nr:hypothetical protein [Reyranella sp.]